MSKRQTTLDCFTGNSERPKPSNLASRTILPQKTISSNATPVSNKFVPNPSANFKSANSASPSSSTPPKCVLISNERFELIFYQFLPSLNDICRNIQTSAYNTTNKRWNFHLSMYNVFMNNVKKLNLNVEALPNVVKLVFNSIITTGKNSKINDIYNLKNVDKTILNILFPFQIEAVNFVISKEGRALIADEMGLGKTLEALAIASYYVNEWPLLIVTPANVRHMWVQAIRQHFSRDYLSPYNVFSPNSNKDMSCSTSLPSCSKSVVVISYDLMKAKIDFLLEKNFRVVILDESHFIKNFKSDRCKAAFKLLKKAKRALLLSGTPALSRPVELWPQLQCINEKLFKNYNEFVHRYCDAKQRPMRFGRGLDTSGSSNLEELEILLKETIMIRREKRDVMNQLQPKRRKKIILSKFLLETKVDDELDLAKKNFFDESLTKKEKRQALMEFFNATSKAKMKPVVNQVLSMVQSGRKMVVFAHHQSMMKNLHAMIDSQGVKMVRIDGSTPSEIRQKYVEKFQKDDQVKVALLSITAACTGLTLTAANIVVFAELYWNPGVLVQAEDRVHRKGQESDVEVQYLIGEGTADEEIWRLLKQKTIVLGKGGLSKDNFDDVSTTTITFQPNIGAAQSKKTTLNDFWDDANDDGDVEIFEENVYTTKNGLKINLNYVFPTSTKVEKNKNELELISFGRPDRNFLPPLKISEIRQSMADMRITSGNLRINPKLEPSEKIEEIVLDSTFCENIEDLFYDRSSNGSHFESILPVCEPSTSKKLSISCDFRIDNIQNSARNRSEVIFTTPRPVTARISSQTVTKREITNLDTSFVDSIEDLFGCSDVVDSQVKMGPVTPDRKRKHSTDSSQIEPKLIANMSLDTSFFAEDLFGCAFDAKAPEDQQKKRSKTCLSPKLNVDFSFDFGLTNVPRDTLMHPTDTAASGPNDNMDVIPPSPEMDRIPASLPIQNCSQFQKSQQISVRSPISSSVDQCCSPIFKPRFNLQINSQKPLATVRPFKINDEVVDEISPIASTSALPPPTPIIENDECYRSLPMKKSNRIRRGNRFIDDEAEQSELGCAGVVSSDEPDSSDDENVYLADSFVDLASESEYVNTQDSKEMHGVYLQSLQSQVVGRRNKYKLAYGVGAHLNVYSQVADSSTRFDEEDSFCYDSFVVPNDFVEYATEEKRIKVKKISKAKRRRRIWTENSSDSDEK